MKYQIEKIDDTTYMVNDVCVWYNNDIARCTKCSGPLTAMLSSCKHAKALKRHMTNTLDKAGESE